MLFAKMQVANYTWAMEKIIGIGLDCCSIKAIQHDISRNNIYILNLFTDDEITYCEGVSNSDRQKEDFLKARRYAGRFAAKEAVIKALGGIHPEGFSWRDINIIRQESGRPFVWLEGRPKARQDDLGISKLFLSITHEGNMAIALCLAIGDSQVLTLPKYDAKFHFSPLLCHKKNFKSR